MSDNKESKAAYKMQLINYYFKQAKNLALLKVERDNYASELFKLLRTL